ncbi:MAG: energy-coupling factor ABC transporter ATP-binding protein [Anaerolineales bacterium]
MDHATLEIDSAESVAIVGENGAGKTTLVKLLNGLLRPSEGRVYVGDWNTKEFSIAQLAARVGFLFQNPDEQLFERTVQREVSFGPRNLGLSEATITRRVRESLKSVGLAELSESNPYDLLPFERKLLALAATLAMHSPVLVLDEPSVGQDAAGRERIRRVLRDLHTMGRTLLIISHDLDFCAEHAERVVVMVDGRVLADGPAKEILSQADILNRAAVHPPQLVRLAQALRMSSAPLTKQDFVRSYSQWRRRKKKTA